MLKLQSNILQKEKSFTPNPNEPVDVARGVAGVAPNPPKEGVDA